MRILLVTHYYRPEIGAPQRRWDALVERFVAAGHQVAVLAPSPHYPSGRVTSTEPKLQPGAVARGRHGEMVHRLRFREYDRRLGGRGMDQATTAVDSVRTGLSRFARRYRPDVVVATVPGLPTLPAGLALGAGLRAPVVVEMRDAWPDLMASRSEWDSAATSSKSPSAAQMSTRTLTASITAMQRCAAAVVTTTDAFAHVLRQRRFRRVVTIRHGTSTAGPLTRPVAHATGPLRVLYAGTVGRSQGLGTAVQSAAECRRRGVSIDLRIVGDGAESAPLRELARQLDVPVTFLPPVPRVEVLDHYGWADTVLIPLRSWEPLRWAVPSKVYDALATGRHITAALSGEAAEIVTRTGGGHVVPPDDVPALAELWGQLSSRRDLLQVGGRGRTWVAENADDDVIGDRYLRVLEAVARHA